MFSSLINGFKLAKWFKKSRDRSIDTITIHHMAGNMTAENCVTMFAAENSRQCSCNYAIGSDGQIWGGVPEESESYCSSDRPNDTRAITIEVANDGGEDTGWHVSDKAISALIDLLVDICRRRKETLPVLRWKGDKSLIGKVDQQNITLHKWFAATGCPGPYLESQIPAIVRRVNARLNHKEESAFTDSQREEVLRLFADFILSKGSEGGEKDDTE